MAVMRTGKIICYTFGSKPTAAERNKIRKQLWGYTDFSNSGRYKYSRKGLLSEIPHIKLIRSVFIVRKEDCYQVVEFLKAHDATVFEKTVVLTKKDEKQLGEKTEKSSESENR